MNDSAFIFDDVCITPDKQIGLNSHRYCELSYITNGAGTRTIGDLTVPFSAGEIVFIPPNIQHCWNFNPNFTDTDGKIANVSVFFELSLITSMKLLFPEITDVLDKIESMKKAVSYRSSAYRTLKRLMEEMRELNAENRLPKMMELLIAIADTSGCINAGRSCTLSKTEKRLEQVRVFCACNFNRNITLDEMSQFVGMNKSAFCTFMRRNTGMTLSAFVNDIRLERAKENLLGTDCGIAEIAMACGFQSVTYFNRLFRKKFRCTPKEIRSN